MVTYTTFDICKQVSICGIYFIPEKLVEKSCGMTLENIWKRVIRYMR
jgi:hypothetical protein